MKEGGIFWSRWADGYVFNTLIRKRIYEGILVEPEPTMFLNEYAQPSVNKCSRNF